MSQILSTLEQRLSALKSEHRLTLDKMTPAQFGPAEQRAANKRAAEIDELADRVDELKAQDAAEQRAAALYSNHDKRGGNYAQVRTNAGGVPIPRAVVTHQEPVYRADDAAAGQSSFFRDTYAARRGDWQAAQRLADNNKLQGMEARALSTTAGAGGQFAPPLWLVNEWIKLARPARVTADLLHKEVLPERVSSVNLPAVATGSTTGVQAAQNTAVSSTDLTSSAISSGIVTIAGQQTISQQLLDQSGIPFDQVILGDLAADYAKQLDAQVISGPGTAGTLKGLTAWGTASTWTQASPVVAGTTPAASFQAQVVKVATALANTRFAPATHLVMSPERWGWIAEAVDSQGRPLVPPAASGGTLNSFGSANEPTAQGPAGTFAGLPVYVDPALTVPSGNETVLILRADDAWLYESELYAQSFDATYANQLGVLFRVHAYSALVSRYAAAIQVVTGTGLVKVTLG